ncbi:MAG: hypothetical protein ABEJ72_05460 [Candidatus Aenigmatarchaeota archaeon]
MNNTKIPLPDAIETEIRSTQKPFYISTETDPDWDEGRLGYVVLDEDPVGPGRYMFTAKKMDDSIYFGMEWADRSISFSSWQYVEVDGLTDESFDDWNNFINWLEDDEEGTGNIERLAENYLLGGSKHLLEDGITYLANRSQLVKKYLDGKTLNLQE